MTRSSTPFTLTFHPDDSLGLTGAEISGYVVKACMDAIDSMPLTPYTARARHVLYAVSSGRVAPADLTAASLPADFQSGS